MKLQTCLTHLTVLRLQCRLRSLCFGLLLLTIINYLTKRAESSQSVFKRYHDKSLRDYSRAVNVYNKLIMQWWCLKEALRASCAGSRGSFRLTCCSCYPPLLSSPLLSVARFWSSAGVLQSPARSPCANMIKHNSFRIALWTEAQYNLTQRRSKGRLEIKYL